MSKKNQNLILSHCNLAVEAPYHLELVIDGVMPGHLPSGKNKYRIGNGRFFKNDPETIEYEAVFEQHAGLIRAAQKDLSEQDKDRYALVAKIFFRSFRRDVDTILFCDLLQKNQVIHNDRQIRIKLLDGVNIDKENPRIEFQLYRIVEAA